MKKLVAMLLAVLMVFAMAACSPINDTEVSILWADDGVVKIPNSLINAMERAMYTKNIEYTHYGAKGDQAAQTKQAEEALNKGCATLVVELVDPSAAQTLVDLAKAKSVPVIFMNCDVDAAVLASYDKCALVDTDESSVGKVQGKQIGDHLVANWDSVDQNADGKITYAYICSEAGHDPIADVDAVLKAAGKSALVDSGAVDIAAVLGGLTEDSRVVELIITDDDAIAQDVFVALQAKGYNKDKLTTNCIPVFTVGDSVDYKAMVLAGRPAGKHDSDAVQEYYKSMQYVVDLRNVEDDDLDTYIYTTSNVIASGRLAGTVVEDNDSTAAAVASIISNILKGEDTFKDVQNVKDKQVLIPYVSQ